MERATLKNLQRMVKNAEEKYAKKGEIALADLSTALQGVITGKADAATTLAGYGITDSMTAEQIGSAISGAVCSKPWESCKRDGRFHNHGRFRRGCWKDASGRHERGYCRYGYNRGKPVIQI